MRQLLMTVRQLVEGFDGPYTLVLIDVDFFIRYCLQFSEDTAAKMMGRMRAFLREAFGGRAWFQPSSGDEMAVLLPGVSHEAGYSLTERVRKAFRRQRFTGELPEAYRHVRIGLSAGVVSFPDDGVCPEEVLSKALTALYMAKALRRNQVFSFRLQAVGEEMRRRRAPPLGARVLYKPDAEIRVVTGRPGLVDIVRGPVPREEGLLWEPQAITVDEQGRLYIANQDAHQILRCDEKELSRVAGDGVFGYSGDGGGARYARFNKPTGLCCRGDRLYVADTGNDAVRLLHLDSGQISTIAGQGRAGFAGDGGLACAALLNKPGGVAADCSGGVYIDDIANNVLRYVGADGIIRRSAGDGRFDYGGDGGPAIEAAFREMYGIGMNRSGDRLYIADYGNHRIREMDLSTGRIRTIAGSGTPGYAGDGGNPLEARICCPVAVCGDDRGNLFIADAGNNAIRILPNGENRLYTLVGGLEAGVGRPGEAGSFLLANPNSLAAYGNELYFLDGANNRVCAVTIHKTFKEDI